MSIADEDKHAGLTQEEIDEVEAEGAIEASAGGDEGKTGAEGDPPREGEAIKAAGEDGKAAGEEESEAAADTGPTEIQAPLRARAPEKAGEAFEAIRTAEEELATKFDDGEITAREYRDGLGKLGEQREELRWSQRKAELASELTQQARENAWHGEVRDFMSTTAANIARSRPAMVAFDEVVKQVTADPANSGLSDRAQLDKAYKLFMEDVGAAFGAKAETPAPTPKPKAGDTPAPAQRNVPPTLAKVPAVEIESTDGGKFAALDRLATSDPAAYEAAVERMSDAEIAQYSAAL